MNVYAIHAAESGTAIIEFERDADQRINVSSIERLPTGLDPVGDWLGKRFPDLPEIGDSRIVIDADGLGRALWQKLGVRSAGGWRLYGKQGRDRQELVNALLVAVSNRWIRIASSDHEPAVRKALAAYQRTVLDDGVIGGEIVVALALATVQKVRPALWVGAA